VRTLDVAEKPRGLADFCPIVFGTGTVLGYSWIARF
jgi:hypothetical protein